MEDHLDGGKIIEKEGVMSKLKSNNKEKRTIK